MVLACNCSSKCKWIISLCLLVFGISLQTLGVGLYTTAMPWWQMIEPNMFILAFNIIAILLSAILLLPNNDKKLPVFGVLGAFSTILIILMGCFAGFQYRETLNTHQDVTFLRVGAVSHNTAKLVLRSPGEDIPMATVEYLDIDSQATQVSAPRELLNNNDYMVTFDLEDLMPGHSYEVYYGDLTASFTTAPEVGTPSDFRFHWGSCYMADFPWNSGQRVWDRVSALEPAFSVFLGDFIYADHPYMKGGEAEDYRRHYRMSATADFTSFNAQTPMFVMFDDHEVDDNWSVEHEYLDTAMEVWEQWFGSANPESHLGKPYFSFDYGDSSFFVLDTRSFRDDQLVPRSILGAEQKADLFAWLSSGNSTTFKFLCSPLPMTLNIEGQDIWQEYAEEREEVIAFITANAIKNVVILSADRHYIYVTSPAEGVLEVSTSPVGAFPDQDTEPFVSEVDATYFMDIRHSNYFGGFASYQSVMDVDTTDPSAPTLRLSIFADKDQSNPIYEATINGATDASEWSFEETSVGGFKRDSSRVVSREPSLMERFGREYLPFLQH